jgi:hypothetical protein
VKEREGEIGRECRGQMCSTRCAIIEEQQSNVAMDLSSFEHVRTPHHYQIYITEHSLLLYMFSSLTTLNHVLKATCNIQRIFSWGGCNKEGKWALVIWEKVCFPKMVGDLGIMDLEVMSQALATKIWWQHGSIVEMNCGVRFGEGNMHMM